MYNQAPSDVARILAGDDHTGEVVESGVDVTAAKTLDECADDVVMLVPSTVVEYSDMSDACSDVFFANAVSTVARC
jgi:hypothetical protein